MDIDSAELERLLRLEIARLADEFRGVFSAESIDRCARDSLDQLQNVRVRRYLPIFAYRFTRERLLALAGVEGIIRSPHPSVLFVCGQNAGRSQMAAALTRHLSNRQVQAYSAGSRPAPAVHSAVIVAMAELGLDVSDEFPKSLTDEIVRAADVVVTMGCGDACALYPFKKYQDWAIEDPAGQPLNKVREIRDSIAVRVQDLLPTLTPQEPKASGS